MVGLRDVPGLCCGEPAPQPQACEFAQKCRHERISLKLALSTWPRPSSDFDAGRLSSSRVGRLRSAPPDAAGDRLSRSVTPTHHSRASSASRA
ncbi:hypothetical protein BTO02_13625 [Paraburkholderia sp. SOS3]|nr:hypothetical protein BTO02_13625 [Paraburkholderia sp. SOS3]